MNEELIDAIPSGRNAASTSRGCIPGVTRSQSGRRRPQPAIWLGRHGGDAPIASVANIDGRTIGSDLGAPAQGSGNHRRRQHRRHQEMEVDTPRRVGRAGRRRRAHQPRFRAKAATRSRGTFFGAFANRSMQGDNISRRAAGPGPDDAQRGSRGTVDVNPGVRRPDQAGQAVVLRSGAVQQATETYVAGIFYNKNAGNPNAWTYEPDTQPRPAANDSNWKERQRAPHVAGDAEEQVRRSPTTIRALQVPEVG